MKKIFIIISYIIIIYFISFTFLFSFEPKNNDEKNDKMLATKIDSLEQNNKELTQKISLTDKRIDDVYKCFEITVILLIALLVGNIANSYFVSKRQAIKELEKLENQIEKIQKDANNLQTAYDALKTSIIEINELKKGE